MSQKKTGKHAPRPAAPAASQKPAPSSIPRPATSSARIIAAFIFLFGFMLYLQTARFGFTLDDRLVVFENQLTTQGIRAIPEIFTKSYLSGSIIPDTKIYRPVSKAVFALCWNISPGKPQLFHLVNIFFYALTGLLLFLTLLKYMPRSWVVPLITTLLFIAHPIHTEVVCSIKSLDEILSFLFFLISLNFLHRYLQDRKAAFLGWSALAFLFSFLSKESGITFLAVFPITAIYLKAGKQTIIRISGIMLLVVAVVFCIRMLILEGPDTNPLSEADNIIAGTNSFLLQKTTAVYLLGKYLLLLLFPHPLVCDYSTKQLSLAGPGNIYFLLSFAVLLAALAYAMMNFRKRDWLAFGILFFFITLSVTSNIFFLGGSHFAERFLYAPSLGFCLAAAVTFDRYVDTKANTPATIRSLIASRPLLAGLAGIILVSYVFKTWQQSPVWKDNVALFENGIKYSPQSYRMHLSLAQDLSEENYVRQFPPEQQTQLYERAIREAKASLLYYRDIDAYDMIGNIFYITGRYDSALVYYLEGLKYEPGYEALNHHAGKALDKLERYREAIPYLDKALAKNPKNDGVLYNLALSYTNLNEIDKGLEYFLKVIELRPNGPDAYHYAGLIYRAKGDLFRAEQYLKKAQELGGPRL